MEFQSIKKRFCAVKLPARASAAYIATSAVAKTMGILTTPIFTRLLNTGEYGSFTLYMSILGFASLTVSAVSSGSAVYKGLSFSGNEKDRFIKSNIATVIAFSSLICLVLFAFSPFFDISTELVAALSVQILCDGIVGFYLTVNKFSYRYREVATVTLLEAILTPALSIIILSYVGGGYRVRIFSILSVSLICAIVSLARLVSQNKRSPSIKEVRTLLRTALPLLPHSIATAASGETDKLILASLLGSSALAKYSVVHSVGIAMTFIIGAILSALNPWIMRRLASDESTTVGEVVSLIFRILCAATVILVALIPEAMLFLAPREYSDASGAALPIALSVLSYFITAVSSVGLMYADGSKLISRASISAALSGVILNYMLIPPLNYLGAGYAQLLSKTISAVLSAYYLTKLSIGGMLVMKEIIYPFFTGNRKRENVSYLPFYANFCT